MKLIYKIMFLILLIPIISTATNIRGKYKKEKEVSKTYKVSNNSILNIKNKFGNVDIVTWNKNVIQIDVKITVSGNDEEILTEQLDKIRIEFNQESNQVFATTHIGKRKSKSFLSNLLSWSSSSNTNFKIDYNIKMPINNHLNITNDYGTIVLTELNGKADIKCDYGKLIIGSLNNTNNNIDINYTTNSNIDFIENAHISADFSKFTIEKINNLDLQADYTTTNITEVNKMEYNCDFGSINIDKVSNFEGHGDYLTIKLGNLSNLADIETSFGSVKIKELTSKFKSLNIKSDYTSVRVGIDNDVSTNIYLESDYGSIKYDGAAFSFPKQIEKSNHKKYEGYFNHKENNANIRISTEFGSIKLYQN